jgi:HEAT repeat protein
MKVGFYACLRSLAAGWTAIGLMGALPEVETREEWRDALQGLDSSLAEERLESVEALAARGRDAHGAVPALIRCIKTDPELTIRLRAVAALGKIGQPVEAVAPALLEAGTDPLGPIRHNASIALSGLPGEAVPLMRDALGDERPWVRLQAARFLLGRESGASPPIGILTSLLREPDVEIQADAALTLGKLESRAAEAVPAISGMLGSDIPKVRRIASHALGRIGPAAKSAAPALRECLIHSDRDVRRDAIAALIAIGDTTPETVESLIEALADPQGRVRNQAVRGLAAIGEPALTAVIRHLSSPRDVIRSEACNVLGWMGPVAAPSASELIVCLREDPDRQPRMNAASALGRIGLATAEILEELRRARDDTGNHAMIRFHAGQSLVQLTGDPDEAAPSSLYRLSGKPAVSIESRESS